VGNPQADLMFIGEAPGADEDRQGEPFVGRAGQLLNNMIKAMGLRREDVYIANIIKCRPPGNRTPEREECETCSPFLMRQIAAIKPKVIVALGAVAAKTLLAINASMAELRGRWYDFKPSGVRSNDPSWTSAKLAVTYHPAFLLRDPRQKRSLERPADGDEGAGVAGIKEGSSVAKAFHMPRSGKKATHRSRKALQITNIQDYIFRLFIR